MGMMKRAGVLALSAVLLFGSVPSQASAKAIKLNKKNFKMKVGDKKTLKVSGVKKVKWSSSKTKVVALLAKKKTSVKLLAKKAGKAVVTAKAGKKKLTCKVTVKNKNKVEVTKAPQNTETPQATTQPGDTPYPGTPTPIPTEVPTPSVTGNKWAYIPVDDDSLLKEYGPVFGNVGTCLTYDGAFNKREMQDAETMAFVRKHYNSFTLENEMKPSYLLAKSEESFWNPPFNKLMTTDEARSKGYFVPVDYTENTIPSINYDRLDAILKISHENGIRMRGHTLIWHSQTPTEFFRAGYKTDGAFVKPEVMDQRIIFFVTNVIKHVYESPYADVIYAWDIVNEYFHQLSDGSGRNWSEVYPIVGSGNALSTTPSFVKLAFKTAHDVLKDYNLQDKVTLFYNDYNTSQVANEIVEMVNYINAADELNPEGEKICDGMGMQCHLGVKWPTVEEQLATAKKFLDAGYEVQITELDIQNDNGASEDTHCDYWYDFMKGLVLMRKEGKPITGVTFWGLSDSVSWRRGSSPLLFGETIKDPKKQLYAAYAAAQAWWGTDMH